MSLCKTFILPDLKSLVKIKKRKSIDNRYILTIKELTLW